MKSLKRKILRNQRAFRNGATWHAETTGSFTSFTLSASDVLASDPQGERNRERVPWIFSGTHIDAHCSLFLGLWPSS
jgi:hypothetical protein